jgi:hypothetical protein
MLCVEQRQDWVLQTLPPKLQYVLKVSFMYLMHITKVLLGGEGEIDIVAVQKRSVLGLITNSSVDYAAIAATKLKTETLIDTEKVANRMMDKLEVTVKKLIMTLFAAILVRHIIVIYLDEDKRARLPAPIRFVMDTIDNPLSKLPTGRVPRILTIIFGLGIAGIAYTGSPEAFWKALLELIRTDPAIKNAVQKSADDLKRSVGILQRAESATTSSAAEPSAQDEDEFYDASLFGESL